MSVTVVMRFFGRTPLFLGRTGAKVKDDRSGGGILAFCRNFYDRLRPSAQSTRERFLIAVRESLTLRHLVGVCDAIHAAMLQTFAGWDAMTDERLLASLQPSAAAQVESC